MNPMVQDSPLDTRSLDPEVSVTLLSTDGRSIVRGAVVTATPTMTLYDVAAAAAAGASVVFADILGVKVSHCSPANPIRWLTTAMFCNCCKAYKRGEVSH